MNIRIELQISSRGYQHLSSSTKHPTTHEQHRHQLCVHLISIYFLNFGSSVLESPSTINQLSNCQSFRSANSLASARLSYSSIRVVMGAGGGSDWQQDRPLAASRALTYSTSNSRHVINKSSLHDAAADDVGLAFTYSIGFAGNRNWSSRVSYPCAAFGYRNTSKQREPLIVMTTVC